MTAAPLIATFGFFGVLTRYLIGVFAARFLPLSFPVSTFAINILGCFLIGYIHVVASEHGLLSENIKLGLMVGFLGGFTTFSAYTLETACLIQDARYLTAGLYFFASSLLGLLGTLAGMHLAR